MTTNLDGIYRKAGLQAHDDVCFLHGNVYTERCTSCGYDFERNRHVRKSNIHVHDHSISTCSRCGSTPPKNYNGRLKAGAQTGADGSGFKENRLVGTHDKNVGTKDTHINFGECLDNMDWGEAEQHCSKADLCIVMGTSMSLRHITHFPFQGKKTVIVNLQKTPDDKKCHLRIWAQCDPVSAGLLARLGLEPMPVPVWRPRDALPLDQIPAYVSKPYREAAERLMQLAAGRDKEAVAARREKEAMATVLEETARMSVQAEDAAKQCTVMVGNSHQKFEDGKHQWRLYVGGKEAESLSSVDVWLHPTFKQSHFKVEAMPFELQCTGWGTFDIRLRLHKRSGGYNDVSWPLQFDQDDAHILVEL